MGFRTLIQPVPLEAQAASRAIEYENIFGRYSPFDGFFGPKFHILTPRWLPTYVQRDSKIGARKSIRRLSRQSSIRRYGFGENRSGAPGFSTT